MRDANPITAIARLREELAPFWQAYSAPVAVTFPAADTDYDIVHNLGQQPDGYLVIESSAPVYRRPGPWATKTLAFLRCPTAGTSATVLFFTLREGRNAT